MPRHRPLAFIAVVAALLPLLLPLAVASSSLPALAATGDMDRMAHTFEYVSPRPGAELVSRGTELLFRLHPEVGSPRRNPLASLDLHGSDSGARTGAWRVATDSRTWIFRPDREFLPGETVAVSVGLRDGGANHSYRFRISPKTQDLPAFDSFAAHEPTPRTATRPRAQPLRAARGFVPPADFPGIEVSIVDNPAPGSLFLSSWGLDELGGAVNYAMILDEVGVPIFFRQTVGRSPDFKTQPGGLLTYFDRSEATPRTVALDLEMSLVDDWYPGNGYPEADGHDFQLLANGHALLFIYDRQPVDMSAIVMGGDPNATVIGLVIQELDTAKNVVFQWRSWDHFDILDATHIDFTAPIVDYVHCNSIESDQDGHILISSRHLDEITKIDRGTGAILWRMGGLRNEFQLVGDSQWFTRQHAARRTSAGTVTVFDNGNFSTPQESRAVEYQVDEINKVAAFVWEFRNSPSSYAASTGNAQRLPNGNTLIDWGNTGLVTEVRPDGTKAFELNLDPGYSYRAFRFPWSGVAAVPTLWADQSPGSLTLHFAKFGDENVTRYNVYRGTSPSPDQLEGWSRGNSFSVSGIVYGETNYFRVAALDSGGAEGGFSNELEITIQDPTSVPEGHGGIAGELALYQSRPNPFRRDTTISFLLPHEALVDLSIHDVRGRLVRTLLRGIGSRGVNEFTWDRRNEGGKTVAAGTYFYRLQVEDEVLSRRVTVLGVK